MKKIAIGAAVALVAVLGLAATASATNAWVPDDAATGSVVDTRADNAWVPAPLP